MANVENPYQITLQHNLVVTTNLQLPSITAENAVYVYNISPLEYFSSIEEGAYSSTRRITQYTESDKEIYYFFDGNEFIADLRFYDISDESLIYYYDYQYKTFSNSNLNLSETEINNRNVYINSKYTSMIDFVNILDASYPSEGTKFPIKIPVIRIAKPLNLISPEENLWEWRVGGLDRYESNQDKKQFYYESSVYNAIYSILMEYGNEITTNSNVPYTIIADPVLNDPDVYKAEFDATTKRLLIRLEYPTGHADQNGYFSIYGINLLVTSSEGMYNKMLLSNINISNNIYLEIGIDLTNEDRLVSILNGYNVTLMYDFIMYYNDNPEPDPTPPTPPTP